VLVAGRRVLVRLLPRFEESHHGDGAAGPSTPVPGTVTIVEVEVGDTVAAGQTLVILEAMKMEHRITADRDGVIAQVLVKPGSSVDAHQVVVVLEEAAE
jgi:biotin carboxyl carrier protein